MTRKVEIMVLVNKYTLNEMDSQMAAVLSVLTKTSRRTGARLLGQEINDKYNECRKDENVYLFFKFRGTLSVKVPFSEQRNKTTRLQLWTGRQKICTST